MTSLQKYIYWPWYWKQLKKAWLWQQIWMCELFRSFWEYALTTQCPFSLSSVVILLGKSHLLFMKKSLFHETERSFDVTLFVSRYPRPPAKWNNKFVFKSSYVSTCVYVYNRYLSFRPNISPSIHVEQSRVSAVWIVFTLSGLDFSYTLYNSFDTSLFFSSRLVHVQLLDWQHAKWRAGEDKIEMCESACVEMYFSCLFIYYSKNKKTPKYLLFQGQNLCAC